MSRASKMMAQPLAVIFRFLQNKARIQIWLYEQSAMRLEGRILGFDEFMNVVLDDAEEVDIAKKTRKPLGRILLKGDNITLICGAPAAATSTATATTTATSTAPSTVAAASGVVGATT